MTEPQLPEHHLVDEPDSLGWGLEWLDDLDPVGVDVERADWDRYWRAAALIQVGGQGRVALVDPIALEDLAPLDDWLRERTVVLHAMENDLAPMASAGIVPPRVEDTAIAAAVLGLPTGLEGLLEELLGVTLASDKNVMQRADWEARPLEAAMLAYAAADVADLPALWQVLDERLADAGRRDWYEQERDDQLRQPAVEDRRNWSRLKGIGRLDPKSKGRVRALWEAREQLAKSTDTAPARIVADKALVDLAVRPPASTRELGRRGMRRQAVRQFGDALLRALATASEVPTERRAGRASTEEDRAAAERLRAIRAETAEELGLDAGVLCPSRTLLGGVLADPAHGEDLRVALGLRPWQWDVLGPRFCEALGLDEPGTPGEEPVATRASRTSAAAGEHLQTNEERDDGERARRRDPADRPC